MRVLVIGGDGMLGHRLVQDLAAAYDVKATLRSDEDRYAHTGLFTRSNSLFNVDVLDQSRLAEILTNFSPDVVINAAGIVKQRGQASEAIPSIEVNSLFPHRLAAMASRAGIRVIHFSTDCVFSGRQGHYRESDVPDPLDLYGRSKLLGEIDGAGCVTLRSSIIGLELANRLGLVEWFLAGTGTIRGFRRVLYSGLTTYEMARVVRRVIEDAPQLSGVWHVASQPISKYDLLESLRRKLGRTDIRIEPEDDVVCDRTLSAERFQKETGYSPPPWDDMLDELAEAIPALNRP